jgi:hypothetical protein
MKNYDDISRNREQDKASEILQVIQEKERQITDLENR